ncbi:MAG TPA: hypothetical protein PLR02_12960 [Rhodocyclaceae bacterium]|nr:hypothetical protein [Zoogloeaceae bacterium]HRD35152.1 hypothetical protein [Rhodocyclaceae bacterium]
MTRVVSTLPGRVRVRDKALRNPALCARVEAQLRQIEGLAVMQPNPSVGSIVLHFAAGDIDPLELERKIDAIIDAAIATPRPSGARPLRLQVNRVAKLGMLGSLTASLALAASGQKRWHAVTGAAFVACLGVHLGVHRRNLLR